MDCYRLDESSSSWWEEILTFAGYLYSSAAEDKSQYLIVGYKILGLCKHPSYHSLPSPRINIHSLGSPIVNRFSVVNNFIRTRASAIAFILTCHSSVECYLARVFSDILIDAHSL
jgi:hypothetical protein